ncbi:hypothetical protein C8F01DRAFT_1224998 [Mycena amicta]|nr:hypothetical protein C8F01DRAFT_1224998 [Mycena amicta]
MSVLTTVSQKTRKTLPLSWWGIDPLWHKEIDREQRTILRNTYWRFSSGDSAIFDGETLLPQGLFFKSDFTGRDSFKWKLLGWLYGGIFYETTAEFRKAWKSHGFVKYELNLHGSKYKQGRGPGKNGTIVQCTGDSDNVPEARYTSGKREEGKDGGK